MLWVVSVKKYEIPLGRDEKKPLDDLMAMSSLDGGDSGVNLQCIVTTI